ncbi:hypothetical protein IT570_06110 [Candidatus Sumerlaeota bacterium]|nr:hypothetical protein [Candidatus Sumerlaeota bacterium]
MPAVAAAQPGIVTSIASGYKVTTISLPVGAQFKGAWGNHASNPNLVILYYNDGTNDVIGKLDVSAGTITPLISDVQTPLAFVGGCALISDTALVWTENGDGPSPMEDVYVAVDGNANGFEAAEVTSLSSKGLNVDDATGQANFTGSRVRVIGAAGIGGLQVGDVVVQTADDDFLTVPIEPSELFVVRNITTPTPSFIPAPGMTNETFFRGTASNQLVYDGGISLGPNQSLIVGSGLSDFNTARIIALHDANADGQINESTEAHSLGDVATGGLYELSTNTEGRLFASSGGTIKTAQIDMSGGNVLTAPPVTAMTNLVTTSSFFLAGVLVDDPALPFPPNGDPLTSARVLFADFNGTEIYVIQPELPSSVTDWEMF